MSWFAALPPILVAVAWLLLPGLAIGYLAGLRGIAAWGLAPVTGIAVIASSAVVLQEFGIGWSAATALVACVIVVAVVAAVVLAVRGKAAFVVAADPLAVSAAGFFGLVPAALLGVPAVVKGIGAPDAISQTYDALFHYNALAYIGDSHRASSLTLATLGNPEVAGAFYPAAWHDLGSLVMMSTGASIPLAATAVTVVATLLVWPLSCLLLVRQLFGRKVGALAVTGTLSVGFTAFPWDLLGFGVLWPNLLGMSFAPAVLAVVFTVTRWVGDDAIGRVRGGLAAAVAVVAAGFAHPNVLFSVGVLGLLPIGARLGVRARVLREEGRVVRGAVEVAAAVAVLWFVWWYTNSAPAFAPVREHYWPPLGTPANAVGEALLNATHGANALWILSVAVVLGMMAAHREWPVLRLVAAGHLATTTLFVLTAAVNTPESMAFTGSWYNDSHRLAAVLPITGVPLAVGGALFLAGRVVSRIDAIARVGRAAAVAGAGLVLVATGGLYAADREGRVAMGYDVPPREQLVGVGAQAFFQRVKDRVPADAVVVGNPFDGSAMLWALAGREVLFPHFRATQSSEQDYVAGHLVDAARDPEVCRAVRHLGIEFLLVGGGTFRTSDPKRDYYRGLADPGPAAGFDLVETDGVSSLYRITACGVQGGPRGRTGR